MVVWLLEDLFKAAFRGLRCSLFQQITQTPVPVVQSRDHQTQQPSGFGFSELWIWPLIRY